MYTIFKKMGKQNVPVERLTIQDGSRHTDDRSMINDPAEFGMKNAAVFFTVRVRAL